MALLRGPWRYNREGVAGLEDRPRSGAPSARQREARPAILEVLHEEIGALPEGAVILARLA